MFYSHLISINCIVYACMFENLSTIYSNQCNMNFFQTVTSRFETSIFDCSSKTCKKVFKILKWNVGVINLRLVFHFDPSLKDNNRFKHMQDISFIKWKELNKCKIFFPFLLFINGMTRGTYPFNFQKVATQGLIQTFCCCFVFKQKTCFGVYRNLMVQRKTVFEA